MHLAVGQPICVVALKWDRSLHKGFPPSTQAE